MENGGCDEPVGKMHTDKVIVVQKYNKDCPIIKQIENAKELGAKTLIIPQSDID